jgi:hypothetical protein
MAAAISVEARRQALRREHFEQRLKRRDGAFLLDQKGWVNRVGGIVHRHDQIEHRLARKPGKPAAILVQHHALTRLARPLATVRAAPRGTFHQSGRVQLRLGPGVAPAEPVLLLNMLVEMLHVPAHVRAVLSQHPSHPVDRHPPSRRFAEPVIDQSGKPFLLIPAPVASELSF